MSDELTSSEPLKPNTDVAVAFLLGLDPEGRHDLAAIDPNLPQGHPDKIEAATFLAGQREDMRFWIDARQGRKNLYTSVNRARDDAPRNKRLAREDIGMIRAIVADIDPSKVKGGDASGANYRAERVRLQSMTHSLAGDPQCPPTAIVDTGGGIQLWWLLPALVPVTPEVRTTVEGIGRTIQQRYRGDGVWDLPRIMRLPGTINLPSPEKQAQGRRAALAAILVEQCSARVFTLGALQAWAPPTKEKSTAKDRPKSAIDMDAVEADTYDELSPELRARFDAYCTEQPTVGALWSGVPAPGQNDVSPSGFEYHLAIWLRKPGIFTITEFAQLVAVWDQQSVTHADNLERRVQRAWDRAPSALGGQGFDDETANTPAATRVDAGTWEIPSDLWADRFTPADLPPEVVPDVIERVARDQARRLGVEAGAPAAALVTAIGSLVPAGNQMQMRQFDTDWKVKPILWTAIIGEPGSNKSATLKYATAPVSRIEAKWAKEYAAERREYDRVNPPKQKATKDAVAKVEAPEPALSKISTEDWPDVPGEPVMKRKVVQDVTTEEVSAILSRNEDGLLFKLDELAAFFGGMDLYRQRAGKDRAFWLEAKEGAATTIDRRSHGPLRVENTAVSVLGGIQPSKITAMGAGLAEDGMLQRFLPIILRRHGQGEDVAPNKACADALENIAAALVNSERRGLFKFTPEGDHERRILEDFLQTEIRRPGLSSALRQWLDKTPNEFGRLSLVFHFIEWHASPEALCGDNPPALVSGATARRARRFLMDFVYSHARVFHQCVLGRTQFEEHIAWIGGYILARGLSTVSLRDIYKNYAPFKPTAARHGLAGIMQALETEDWLSPRHERQKDGRPTCWSVNPEVHELFAAKATEEREARLAAQNSIREEGAGRRKATKPDETLMSPTLSEMIG